MTNRKIILLLSIFSVFSLSSALHYIQKEDITLRDISRNRINEAHYVYNNIMYGEVINSTKKVYIPKKYQKFIIEICTENQVPIWIFARLIQSESNWNKNAINYNYKEIYKKGRKIKIVDSTDKGIAQLNDKWYEYFSWKFNSFEEVNPFDDFQSLEISCKYLKHLYKSTNDWYDALCAYKTGLQKVYNKQVPEYIYEVVDKIMFM